MTNTTKATLMDKYAMRKLSKQEASLINDMLEKDPNFQVELDMTRDIADSTILVGNRELRLTLDKIHRRVVDKGATSTRSWWKILLVGMIAILGVSLAYLLSDKSGAQAVSTVQFASYYTPLESTSRSTAAEEETFSSYIADYRAGEYEKVLATVTPLLDGGDNEVRLIAAIASLETGDFETAKAQLQKITVSDDFYYVDHAKWFQALLYINQNKTAEAVPLLGDLAKDKNADHHSEAVALLKSLR